MTLNQVDRVREFDNQIGRDETIERRGGGTRKTIENIERHLSFTAFL